MLAEATFSFESLGGKVNKRYLMQTKPNKKYAKEESMALDDGGADASSLSAALFFSFSWASFAARFASSNE
jgi:hypothetical protein